MRQDIPTSAAATASAITILLALPLLTTAFSKLSFSSFESQQPLSFCSHRSTDSNHHSSLKRNDDSNEDDDSSRHQQQQQQVKNDNILQYKKCTSAARKRFQGCNVLITGASGGLGEALARQFAICGVHTLMLTGRNENSLQRVAKSCELLASQHYPNDHEKTKQDDRNDDCCELTVYVLPCDLEDLTAVQALGDRASRLCSNTKSGCIDILVNNGGISSRSKFIDTNIDVDQLLMKVNFHAGSLLAKIIIPTMIVQRHKKTNEKDHRRKAVIWISSVQGLVGIPNRTSYVASKFAIQGYCDALRAELASGGISVHVASPGYIRTTLSQNAIVGDGTKWKKMDDTTEKGANPKDVAAEILNKVAIGTLNFIVSAPLSARIAIWLNFMAPNVLARLLVKRFDTSLEE